MDHATLATTALGALIALGPIVPRPIRRRARRICIPSGTGRWTCYRVRPRR